MKNEYQNTIEKSKIINGDSLKLNQYVPQDSIDLVFTSPPYFNARPYSVYSDYDEYLKFMEQIIQKIHYVLKPGRFFVLNSSPVIVARNKRSEESVRLPIPFDLNHITMNNGFNFIEDIIWQKPNESVKGRNRSFLQNKNPLCYKPNIVTEYVMVYRKKSDHLIDWHIHNHPNKELIEQSKIKDCEKTNIWEISPKVNKFHPAVFPIELSNKIIQYYSFINDFVLDPFAGSGTVGISAIKNKRQFILIEKEKQYFNLIKNNILPYIENNKIEIIEE